MDINILRSISTVLFMTAFLWICWWAYSKKRKPGFSEAANLPFADEKTNQEPSAQHEGNGAKTQ